MAMDDNGNPTFLSFAVEPHYGLAWVEAIMRMEGMTRGEVIEKLERGGPHGGHLPYEEAVRLRFPREVSL